MMTTITKKFVSTVQVTSKTYTLYEATMSYDTGEEIKEYWMYSQDGKSMWAGYCINEAESVWQFQTLKGTKIQRGGNPVNFFIVGNIVARVK